MAVLLDLSSQHMPFLNVSKREEERREGRGERREERGKREKREKREGEGEGSNGVRLPLCKSKMPVHVSDENVQRRLCKY